MQLHRACVVIVAVASLWAVAPSTSFAGIPECGGLRLEDVSGCEIKASAECMGSCMGGIYKVACATRLQRQCRTECTLSAMPTCTDNCTTMCQSECDRGVSITCQHNCFRECEGTCTTRCNAMPAGDMRDQCTASCEATCDGECDVQCPAVVDGSCYEHCIECCDGSCTAQANMDCQTNCQDVEFEDCERELRVSCDASCSADGAIFCDGVFVLAGTQIPACVDALIARGIPPVDARVEVMGSLSTSGKGCSVGPSRTPGGLAALFFILALIPIAGSRRLRR